MQEDDGSNSGFETHSYVMFEESSDVADEPSTQDVMWFEQNAENNPVPQGFWDAFLVPVLTPLQWCVMIPKMQSHVVSTGAGLCIYINFWKQPCPAP